MALHRGFSAIIAAIQPIKIEAGRVTRRGVHG